MSEKDQEPKLVLTEKQRQGMKIANMFVENWAAGISIETVVRIHRFDGDEPTRFDQVLKEFPFLSRANLDDGSNEEMVKLTLKEVLADLVDTLQEDDFRSEVKPWIEAASEGKERP
jgi:hypothetical protein